MTASDYLPQDLDQATLIGRVFDPAVGGPCIVHLRGDQLADITAAGPTVSGLLEREDLLSAVREVPAARSFALDDVLANSLAGRLDAPHLLAPCDLQAVKACGVTFARSMLERVIEERARGDYRAAATIRAQIGNAIGGQLRDLKPGSEAAARAKTMLMEAGYWSQYLEVGIGPDAEVFTKAPVLASVGLGAEIGILKKSSWNNPEPEAVLAVNSRGAILGATLGNDVNLRDIEGRSALLLGKAKDNNASSTIGPFIRLFDEHFTLDDVRKLEITLRVTGASDGYVLEGASSMSEISRDPTELVSHAIGAHHHYPDGFVLFLGTLFAPIQDRDTPGQGFTHKTGDRVEIAAPQLGRLVNTVTYAEDAAPWTFGIGALMRNLAERNLLGKS
ncbi:fumarylacetoacetate hydrolase family protein [Acidisoma cellulosilytica]|uniref:Fumarylacetoacetate hydrolase family protein n=1 Tax=Acidisoma cellulosilyticum TaxID=2802395 RepID=A0A963YYY8_9PROT|nr:fumarylacetoacetate hydrolase family protein [Acidisoma cellulosilyticum]MCB8878753.1 fumarylacetoacetate hydrolase family protein [Acidisoma cellulosilyticum]